MNDADKGDVNVNQISEDEIEDLSSSSENDDSFKGESHSSSSSGDEKEDNESGLPY